MNLRRIAAVAALILGVCVLGATPARADLGGIRQNAENGDAGAQLHLGILYEFGYHLADHDIQALVWYTLAADQGSQEAAKRRDLLARRLTAKDREEVARQVAELKAKMPPASSAVPAAAKPATEPSDAAASGAPAPASAMPHGGASNDPSGKMPVPASATPAATP